MPTNQLLAAEQPEDNSIFEKDPHSFAEPDKVKISDLYLQLEPSFEKRQFSGVAELSLNWLTDKAKDLVLDTKKLNIEKVEALNEDGQWESVGYQLSEKQDPILGQALYVNVTAKNPKVRIAYKTSPDAFGLQWLDPKQTATKQFPYVYSHNEPINARSWIPLQDTPAVRFTYRAKIKTPKELRAVMSADNDPYHPLNGEFEFTMPQKIPSYLIALAIGNIAAQATGPRTAIYSEPTIVGPAAKEFEDTEQMVQTTEKLYGPYRWDRYDILVLPPSFPMGGMENPRLTFATPTVIAGDKSLVSLVSHELAHSWSGNLVTNAAWRHIWLNEGFTSYVSSRIVEAVYGKEQADQEFIVELNGLNEEMQSLSLPDQRLVPDLVGRDPHDGFSDVAYVKGEWFLKTLEKKFGRDVFDNFLRQYFEHFAFQSATTDNFVNFLQKNLIHQYPDKCNIDEINEWLYQPGIPKDAIQVNSERFKLIDAELDQWLQGKINASDLKIDTWTSPEKQHFLDNLIGKTLTQTQMQSLDDRYHFTGIGNSEVAVRWYKLAIANDYEPAKPAIRQHLLNIGRRILVAPLYEALLKTEKNRAFALEAYREARPSYHSLTRETIDKKFEGYALKVEDTKSVESRAFKSLQLANLTQFKLPKDEDMSDKKVTEAMPDNQCAP